MVLSQAAGVRIFMEDSHRLTQSCARCRLSTVRSADHTIVMEAGRIVEQGTHDSLLAEGKIYATLVRRQAGGAGEQAHLSDSNKTAVAGLQTPSADGSEVCACLEMLLNDNDGNSSGLYGLCLTWPCCSVQMACNMTVCCVLN